MEVSKRMRKLLKNIFSKNISSLMLPIYIAIILSMSVGFIDLIIDILAGQAKGVPVNVLIMSLAVTIGVVSLVYVVLWFFVAERIRRIFKLQGIPWAISIALFIGVFFLFGSIHGLIKFSLSMAEVLKIFMVVVFSSIISTIAYFAVKSISEIPSYSKTAIAFVFTTPFLIAEFVLISLSSLSPFWTITSFLISGLLTIFLFYRLSSKSRIQLLIALFGAILILAPLSGFIPSGNAPSEGVFLPIEHKVKRIILITVDSLRTDFVSAFNGGAPTTTYIDRLADESIVFTQVISPAPWTLPSLSSLMTGLSLEVHMTRRKNSKLPDRLHTLAEYMRDNGYVTGAIVVNPYFKLPYNISQGFLHYDVYPKVLIGNSFGSRLLKKIFNHRFRQDVTTSDLTDLAIDWLKLMQEKDYFLWVHYLDPHMPYAPPDKFLPKGKAPATIGTKFNILIRNIHAGVFTPSLSEREWIRKLYDGEVRYVDKCIGRLIDTLKQLNMYNDSLIILTADHGEELWEHGNFEHGHSLYNELLWVPLIIKLPLSSSKARINKRVQTHSVMPTILDICGITYDSDHLSVASITPLWKGNPGTFDEGPIVSSGLLYYEDKEALIFDGLKYINYLVTDREELYDLNRDPKEQFNIANVNPGIIDKARDIMKKYHAQAKRLRDYYQIEKAAEIKLDPKTIQALESLGYVK